MKKDYQLHHHKDPKKLYQDIEKGRISLGLKMWLAHWSLQAASVECTKEIRDIFYYTKSNWWNTIIAIIMRYSDLRNKKAQLSFINTAESYYQCWLARSLIDYSLKYLKRIDINSDQLSTTYFLHDGEEYIERYFK